MYCWIKHSEVAKSVEQRTFPLAFDSMWNLQPNYWQGSQSTTNLRKTEQAEVVWTETEGGLLIATHQDSAL